LQFELAPVWGSLARDYLAIMVPSVSSGHAFASAGITISKHCNQLKGDIVEALQFLKCLINCDLLSCISEALVDNDEHQEVETEVHAEDDGQLAENSGSWDIFVDNDPDNYELPITSES
jgi:hypothetical protein